jgi:hypothetical protein
MARKIVQIACCGVDNVQSTQCNFFLYALCDDGTLFGRCNNENAWWQVPPIPDAPKETNQPAKCICKIDNESGLGRPILEIVKKCPQHGHHCEG